MHSDLIRQAVLLLHFRVVSLDSGCEEESPSHGTGKGWGAEGGKVRCPCPVGCVSACVSLPLPCFICSAFCKRVPRTKAHALPASCSVISAH